MTIRFSVQYDRDVVDAIVEALARAPRTMREFFETGAKQKLQNTLIADLQTSTPGAPTYPLTWRSEKQRRAFFATDGFGRGIPTQRTGLLAESWDIAVIENRNFGTDIALTNDADYAPFVVEGAITDDSIRQPMFPHWFDVNEKIAAHLDDVQIDIIDTWLAIVDTPPGTFR